MTNKEDEVKTPNIFQMLRTFTKELTKYVASGQPHVTAEQYADRLDTCTKCPLLNEKLMRCKVCGCLLEHKAKWATTVCPDNPPRWKDITNDKG